MKLEQILPEIRKGRRWRIKGHLKWNGPLEQLAEGQDRVLIVSWKDVNEEFELEPKPAEVTSGGWKFKEQPNYGMAISFLEGQFIGNMRFSDIDALHAASLKARGIEEKPRWEQDPKHPVPVCIHCGMGLQAHPSPESYCPNGILQDTSQFTGVDPLYREYKEPSGTSIDRWSHFYSRHDTTFSETVRMIYQEGWDAYYNALKEEA